MQQVKKLNQALGIAALALLFGAAPVYAQSDKATPGNTGSSGQSDATSASPATSGSSAETSGASADSSKSAAGAGASGKALSKGDQNIMRDMAQSNLAEIATAKIALEQSKNEVVKTFAQKMIDDHTQAQKDLEQLAQDKGVKLPTEPDRKHQAAAKQLKALEGDNFDRKYLSQGGVSDHRQTHKMLQQAQNRAKDPDLKALVEKTAPIVEQHLTMVEDAHGEKTTSSGASGAAGSSSSSSGSDKASGASGAADSAAPEKK